MGGSLKEGGSFGNYRVLRLLGSGGMGEVWLLESSAGGLIAAKILDPAQAGDRESRTRFLREAQLALGMKHPNLVETYDVGEDPDTGLCYILMEYMPGGTLEDELRRRGTMTIENAVAVVRAMAAVLEVGWRKGVVHRDIKPANIMFAEDGTPKLADFGIARGSVGGADTTTVTQTNILIGTPAYMAPEQMLDSHNVDTRADIYSLGVVFFEMLTGERPNKNDTLMQLMAKAVKGERLPDVRTLRPEVSASIAQLLDTMVAPDRTARIQAPRRIIHALADIVRKGDYRVDIALVRKREKAEQAAARRKKRMRRQILMLAALALLAAGGIVGVVAGIQRLMLEETEAPQETHDSEERVRPIAPEAREVDGGDEDATDDEDETEDEPTGNDEPEVVEKPAEGIPSEPQPTVDAPAEPTEPIPAPTTNQTDAVDSPPPEVGDEDAAKAAEPVVVLDKWGKRPPVMTAAEVKKRLKDVVLEDMSFKGPVTLREVVVYFRSQLGLNFVLPCGVPNTQPVQLPQMQNVGARHALNFVCDVMDLRGEIHGNIVLFLPKRATWRWTPLPDADLAQALKRTRISELEVKPPMTIVDLLELLSAEVRKQGGKANMFSKPAKNGKYPVLPEMSLRNVSAWDVLDLASRAVSMEIRIRKNPEMLGVCPIENDAGAEPDKKGPRLSSFEAKRLRDKTGWNSMRKTVSKLFPAWRMCDKLCDTLPKSFRKRNDLDLGYYRAYRGRYDVLKTFGDGDVIETVNLVQIREDSELRFFVNAPKGVTITVWDELIGKGTRRSRGFARFKVDRDGWQEAVIDLSEFAGRWMRLTLTVSDMREVYWSDLRLGRAEEDDE